MPDGKALKVATYITIVALVTCIAWMAPMAIDNTKRCDAIRAEDSKVWQALLDKANAATESEKKDHRADNLANKQEIYALQLRYMTRLERYEDALNGLKQTKDSVNKQTQ